MFEVTRARAAFQEPHREVTSSDGKVLFMRTWLPPAKFPNMPAILFLHGITAHSGAYNNILATPLARAGFPVYGLDLRGHGLSDGARGDAPSKNRLAEDICEVAAFLKRQHPRLVLLGHSVGVVIATLAINQDPVLFHAVAFLSLARRFQGGAHKKRSMLAKLKTGLSALLRPSLPVISYSHPGIAGVGDPLYTFTYTLRFMRAINPATFQFPPTIDVPVFVGAGERDELFLVEDVRRLFEEVPARQKTFHVIAGAKHAAFPEGCLNPLFEWLRVVGT